MTPNARSSSSSPVAPPAPVRGVRVVRLEEEILGDPSGRSLWRAMPRRVTGRSRDRLDALAERWWERRAQSHAGPAVVARLLAAHEAGESIRLESRGPEPSVRAIARHLGADEFTARPVELRDGRATGRILDEVREFRTACDARDTRAPAVLVAADDGVPPFSVRRALAGKRLLVVGVSGFIGKVWLAQVLRDLPDVGRITLMLRSRGATAAPDRFERMLRQSPVFEAVRDSIGPALDERVRDLVEIVDGDLTRPGLGLDPAVAERLGDEVDLVISCAGLTEFNPDPRDALAVNVDGTLALLELVRQSRKAGLLHVSTCYVAGGREGRIDERIDPAHTPSGRRDFDPEAEWAGLHRLVEETMRRGGPVRRVLVEAGCRRARALGWPNVYTYTKALGEALLATRGRDLPVATVRPSIVESARGFPFPGWNEGVNTSCPLSHLLGTVFRQLPVNDRKRLDVVPVDEVARGITLVAAALADRRHAEVYQLSTSGTNPLDLARAVELTALAHGQHYRQTGGWRQQVLARLEAVPVSRERYERFSVPRLVRLAQGLDRLLPSGFPGKRKLGRAERTLRRIRELIELYEPFLLDAEPVYEAERIEALTAALPEDERLLFGWDVRSLDWHDYWIRVHIPGLRRWSYPVLERRLAAADGRDGRGRGRRGGRKAGGRKTGGRREGQPAEPVTPAGASR